MRIDALDDLSLGSMDNLGRSLENSAFSFHLGSVLDEKITSRLVDRADVVFHLAALVGMQNILHAGEKTLEVNARGSYKVLKACARQKKRCVVFSSSDVYGNGTGSYISEEDSLDPGPRRSARWYYAVAKICAERAASVHFKRSGLPVTVVRPFNAAGPGQAWSAGMVLPTFVRQALSGAPIRVHGNGEQRRTFVASENLVDQVIGLAMDDRSIGMVVNVGGVEEHSVNGLAYMVKEVLGSSSAVRHVPYKQVFGEGYVDVWRRRPDLSLLEKLGHCRPFKPLRDVIHEMAVSQGHESGGNRSWPGY